MANAERERYEKISENREKLVKWKQKKGGRMSKRKREGGKRDQGRKKCNSSSTHAANTLLPDLRGLHF